MRILSRGVAPAGALVSLLLTGCAADETAAPGPAIAVQNYRMSNVTRSPYSDGYASFSPDGKRLAFSSVRDGNRDLYLLTLATGATQRLTDHPADDGGPPAWSADGRRLYFRSKRGGEKYNIYELDLMTDEVTRLTKADGGEGYVDVSPDGRLLAFHSERDHTSSDDNLEVYVMDLATGEQRRVTRQPRMRNGGPDWLPDGQRLVNVARSETGSSIQVTDLSGNLLAESAGTARQDTFIGTLSPFGKRFVFYSNREGGAIGLYALEMGGPTLTRITTGRATFSTPQFSPGGRYIALQYDDGSPSDIVLLDLSQAVNGNYVRGKDLLTMASNRFEFPEAITLLEAGAEEAPDFGPTRLWLAMGYSKLSKWDAAAEQVAQARRLNAGLNESERLLLAAVDAQVNGDPVTEIAAWHALLALDPGDHWAWYNLAAAHMVVEDYGAAITATDAALSLVGDAARWEASWIYYVRSKALSRMGEHDRAIAAAQPGEDSETTWRSALYRLAIAQFGAGQLDAGRKSILSYIDWSRREGRISEAFLDINVGLLYQETGDLVAAEGYLRKGLENAPDKAYAYWALGYLLLESARVDEGMEILSAGLQLDDANADLLEAYGWGLYRQGQAEAGRGYLLRARARYGRYNHRLEQHLNTIMSAITDPGAAPAPPIPWLS